LDALASWLTAAATALAEGRPATELNSVQMALDWYKSAVAEAGQEGLAYEAGKDDVQRVFALMFLFEQMVQNLHDLADRVDELASARKTERDDRASS
jgi:hypothetical protein